MSFIKQLQFIAEKAASLPKKANGGLQKLADEQWDTIESSCLSLANSVQGISKNVATAREAQREYEVRLVSQISSSIEDFCASGKLNNPTTFRRNIILIFVGPERGAFDTQQTKSRKAQTRSRCHQIRTWEPGALAVWAATLPPVAWAGGAMSQRTFDFLSRRLHNNFEHRPPHVVYESLRELETEIPLNQVHDFSDFVKCFEEWLRGAHNPVRAKDLYTPTGDIISSSEVNVEQSAALVEEPAGLRLEPPTSLTGDVYELTFEDVQAVTISDQIRGRMWLTDTYDVNTPPFITIPISRKLRDQFTSQRPKMM